MSLRLLRLFTVLATSLAFAGVATPAQANEDRRPAVNCAPPVEVGDLAYVFTGEGHAVASTAGVVSMTIHCDYFGFNLSWWSEATGGAVVVLHDQAFLQFGEFDTVCQSAEVVYSDTSTASTPETCRPILQPAADPGPVPYLETAPLLRCDHTRGPSVSHTWIVETTGVAPVRTGDAAVSTYVECTLSAANDSVTASGTAVGGAAAATNAGLDSVSPLSGKCALMRVQYRFSGLYQTSFCEGF